VDADELIERLKNALGDKALILDAQRLSAALMGDPIASNMFMLGAAWQRGLVPIRREAIDRAIELNDVAIDANKQAFEWGTRWAHPMSVETLVGHATSRRTAFARCAMQRRVAHLTDYRDAAYAARYANVERCARRKKRGPGGGADHNRRARPSQAALASRTSSGAAVCRA
jgi:indolepyruvate ferredoxin oxidoreductase